MKTTFTSILLLLSMSLTYGQTHVKLSGETSARFAEKVKPKNGKLVHSVIETEAWGTPQKCIISFYHVRDESGFVTYLQGYIYYPLDSVAYKSIALQPIESVHNAPVEVMSVFFVNADRDGQKELAVLCSEEIHNHDLYGTIYRTYFFDSPSANADELFFFEELSGKFYDCDCTPTRNLTIAPKGTGSIARFTTAKAIRAELKRLGY